jgi:1-acyl-sn-glycerol-3-phosphate acyltransferase
MTEQSPDPLARLGARIAAPWHSAFYWLMTRLMRSVVLIFGRYEIVGVEHVPAEGPLIVVANHLNNADPPLLGAAIPRRIRFMAKQELFETKAGVFYRWFGAFPVRRFEADLAALRQAQGTLKEGGVLGMFPEGHRSHGDGMGPPHPGTALIALRTGAPLLPVGITGTEAIRTPMVLLRNPRIRVVIGEPFQLPVTRRISSAQVEAGTDEIMHRIAALLPSRYRGAYGGERTESPHRATRRGRKDSVGTQSEAIGRQ